MAFSPASSMATPTICSPCGPYFFCNSTSHGISILHGSHQVAQKFKSTALPFSDESCMVLSWLSRTFKVKSGAVVPLSGPATEPGTAVLACPCGGRVKRLPPIRRAVMPSTTTAIKITLFFTSPSHGEPIQEPQIIVNNGKVPREYQHTD